MIYIGNNKISDLYIGDSKINAVIKGGKIFCRKLDHIVKYTLQYNVLSSDNDGTVQNMPDNEIQQTDDMFAIFQISNKVPVRSGYIFSHWTVGPSGRVLYSGDSYLLKGGLGTSSSVSIYAHFTKN